MNVNAKFSEQVAILDTIDPASTAASTVVTAYVPVANFHRIAALLQTGALGTSATVDAKLRQATDSSGTSAKDITGKAITQLVKANDDNKQVVIECAADDLDTANSFTHVALSVTVGTAASLISAVLMGTAARYEPASAFNQAAVAELV